MPYFIIVFVRIVDRFMMYTLFLLIAILAWSTISKQIFVVPAYWTLEAAQFVLVAYYLVGGAYKRVNLMVLPGVGLTLPIVKAGLRFLRTCKSYSKSQWSVSLLSSSMVLGR
jgi:hypothetical protein